ncbi:hypothetical protein [Salipiger mucosus]|uniref:Uncharacterized protein n=1 Tax=Salipiger mucosus DSM 16094 TaxID=1123237 RepID=S9SCK2_9RHOB|nr:hypothetical protein [Salipiger mucosus]EPX83969.1 hypothetical protein Salmuc_01744 [Salipiger mucosus DSM 16094]
MKDQHFDMEQSTAVGMPTGSNLPSFTNATDTLNVAFSAEFHVDATDSALAATDVHEEVRRSFAGFLDDRAVEQDSMITGDEALIELAQEDTKADFLVTESVLGYDGALDDDNDDEERYLAISSAPAPLDDAMSMALEATDKMSSDAISTSAPTEMTVQIRLSDSENSISPLDLVLNLNEHTWLSRFGRAQAVLPGEGSWVKMTLAEIVIQEYFRRPTRLTQHDDLALWEEHLTEIVEYLIEEGFDGSCATSVHSGRKGVDFYHIGGESYEDDFMPIHATMAEMAYAVDQAVQPTGPEGREYQKRARRSNLRAFASRILKLQDVVDTLEFRDDDSARFVSKKILTDGQEIGSVQKMGVEMVKVGSIAAPVETGDTASYRPIAALLSERLANT